MKARANVEGLPDCPFDMTEPEYASLVFEPVCHVRQFIRCYSPLFLTSI